MDKLIKLINEYEQLNMCRKFDNFAMHTFEDSSGVDSMLEDTVISRRYGFIEWLVQENKIDTQNLITYMNWTSLTFNKVPSTDCTNIDKIWNDFYTECLLMLLAIKKNPISFLTSILK